MATKKLGSFELQHIVVTIVKRSCLAAIKYGCGSVNADLLGAELQEPARVDGHGGGEDQHDEGDRFGLVLKWSANGLEAMLQTIIMASVQKC